MYMTLVVLAVACLVCGYLIGARAAGGDADPDLLDALQRRDTFIDHLREQMWLERDLSPALATIAIDEIRKFTTNPRGWEPPSLGGTGT